MDGSMISRSSWQTTKWRTWNKTNFNIELCINQTFFVCVFLSFFLLLLEFEIMHSSVSDSFNFFSFFCSHRTSTLAMFLNYCYYCFACHSSLKLERPKKESFLFFWERERKMSSIFISSISSYTFKTCFNYESISFASVRKIYFRGTLLRRRKIIRSDSILRENMVN